MFTTTAVAMTIGIARWVEWLTDDEIRTVKLVAFLGAILIMLGLIADRITWMWAQAEAQIEAAKAQKDATLPLKRTASAAVLLAVATVVLAVATMILALVTLATYNVPWAIIKRKITPLLPTKDGGVLHTIREGIGRWKELTLNRLIVRQRWQWQR
jgi:hypothetical protein